MVLLCLSWPFCQIISVQNLRTFGPSHEILILITVVQKHRGTDKLLFGVFKQLNL